MAGRSGDSQDDLDRNLAFLAYGLMFFAFFFAGAPALIAVAIAYGRRNIAEPLVRRHHTYQITVFWIGFGLAVLSAVMGLGAVVIGFAAAFKVLTDKDPSANLDAFFSEVYKESVSNHAIPILLISAFVFLITTGLWLVGASGYGFFRLASNKPVGQSSPS